jgi:hypothetical protein
MYTIDGGPYTAQTGRDGYINFNIEFVKHTAKYLGKDPESMFKSIYEESVKE